MTVKELIEVLEKLPQDMEVLDGHMETWWSEMREDRIKEYEGAVIIE